MARRVYSTSTDYSDTALRAASRLVDQLMRGRVYDTDADGMPTDPDDAATLAEATELIAGALTTSGAIDAASASAWDSVKIGTVSLSGRTGPATSTVTVAGVAIPAGAILALLDVGTFQLNVGGARYTRPLDRVAR